MIRGPVRLYQKLERMIQKGRHGSALNSLIKLAFSASILGGEGMQGLSRQKGGIGLLC